MLKRIDLTNVRVFGKKSWSFELTPLTIFCGSNSAGKSTILKTLLVLRQSLGIRESQAAKPGQLRLIGSQVDMGNYQTLVSDEKLDRFISIGVTLDDVIPQFWIDRVRSRMRDRHDAMHTENVAYSLEAHFTFRASHPEDSQATPQGILHRADFKLSTEQLPPIEWQVDADDTGPERKYFVTMPSSVEDYGPTQKTRKSSKELNKTSRYGAILKGIIPAFYERSLNVPGTKEGAQDNLFTLPLPSILAGAMRDLETSLANVQYLGPLRSPARRYYLVSSDVDLEMDPAGELLPYILRELGGSTVYHALPGAAAASSGSLLSALNTWLHFFRTGDESRIEADQDEIAISRYQDVIVEFKLRSPLGEKPHSLADSGFGYSQLLPILVRGLLSPRRSVLVIEQPEVHLNPALQVRLATFLVSLLRAGKQVLIETHSEHIVNAVRVLAAEDTSGSIFGKTSILFLGSSIEGPEVIPLHMEADGTVPEWPREFFGESVALAGRLLRAQRKFRKLLNAKSSDA